MNALKFEMNMEENLADLLGELKSRTYAPGRSICFVVTEPVPREIFAADFRDRIVHHLLVSEVIRYAENRFIFDSYACRKGKGTLLAVKRLQKFVRWAAKGAKPVFYAQMDIKSFFMRIDQRILFEIFQKLIGKTNREKEWQEQILWLAETVIFHQPGQNYVTKGQMSLFNLIPKEKSLLKQPVGKGLPIGNYTSQFFANLYLNRLDHFIKRNLKCRFYTRYVDDFIILETDRKKLKVLPAAINQFLKEELALQLNAGKTKMQVVEKGIAFLGYFLKPSHLLVRNRVVKRLKNRLFALNQEKPSELNLKNVESVVNSYFGHFKHAASYNLRIDILQKHFGRLAPRFRTKNNFASVAIKNRFSPDSAGVWKHSSPARASAYDNHVSAAF